MSHFWDSINLPKHAFDALGRARYRRLVTSYVNGVSHLDRDDGALQAFDDVSDSALDIPFILRHTGSINELWGVGTDQARTLSEAQDAEDALHNIAQWALYGDVIAAMEAR